jgi:hypothetical protein
MAVLSGQRLLDHFAQPLRQCSTGCGRPHHQHDGVEVKRVDGQLSVPCWGLDASLQRLPQVGHVGLLFAADGEQEEREGQPEPAVRPRLELGVQSGAFRNRLESAGDRDLDGAIVVHRPGVRPVEADGASSTYGLFFHFARYLVPGPTGPSVIFSMT